MMSLSPLDANTRSGLSRESSSPWYLPVSIEKKKKLWTSASRSGDEFASLRPYLRPLIDSSQLCWSSNLCPCSTNLLCMLYSLWSLIRSVIKSDENKDPIKTTCTDVRSMLQRVGQKPRSDLASTKTLFHSTLQSPLASKFLQWYYPTSFKVIVCPAGNLKQSIRSSSLAGTHSSNSLALSTSLQNSHIILLLPSWLLNWSQLLHTHPGVLTGDVKTSIIMFYSV
jgi:hypothetical protein